MRLVSQLACLASETNAIFVRGTEEFTGVSFRGRTAASKSAYPGSIPGAPAVVTLRKAPQITEGLTRGCNVEHRFNSGRGDALITHGATAARLTLTQEIKVRILASELETRVERHWWID